jgi:hypothetical protein
MDQQNYLFVREQAVHRYVRALDAGNLDEITAVLQIAERDAELDRIIGEINNSYAEELVLTPTAQDAEQVRSILHTHLPRARQNVLNDAPLTVSEVVARLIADRSIPESDQETSLALLRIQMALPEWLSLAEIHKIGEQLRVEASDRFWKMFRNAAIQMSIGRGQAQMAAARQKRTRRTRPSYEDHAEKHNDQ